MATNYVTQLYDHFLGDQVVDVEPTTALRHCLVLMLGCPVLFGVALHFRDALKRLTCGNAYLAVYLFGSVQLVLTYFRTEAAHALGHSDLLGDLLPPFPAAVATAVALAGQALNFLVYYRCAVSRSGPSPAVLGLMPCRADPPSSRSLGPVGVYYGNAFGIDLPWCTEFPFGKNGLPHPQVRRHMGPSDRTSHRSQNPTRRPPAD